MTWERFGYITRRAHAEQKSGSNVSKSIDIARMAQGINLYGENLKVKSLPSMILQKLKTSSKNKEALAIYSKLSLSDDLSEPPAAKRIGIYMLYVTILYFFMSLIYNTKVLPEFIEISGEFGMPISSEMIFYQNYGSLLSAGLFLILLAAYIIIARTRTLFQYPGDIENGLLFRLFMPSKIKKSYLNILDIMYYPIKSDDEKTSQISSHLLTVDQAELCVATEIQALLKNQVRTLTESYEQLTRRIYTVAGVVIILSIYSFISSAYSPIFILGESI